MIVRTYSKVRELMTKQTNMPVVDPTLSTGVDVGGTKVHILDTSSPRVHRYTTTDYASIYDILDDYFARLGKRPARIVAAMAGPRDDETGDITLTNLNQVFSLREAAERYPGTAFETVNDMIGAAAGMLVETGIDLEQLKAGSPIKTGTKLIITISTGIGAAAAVWDQHAKRHVFVAGEGGHIGIQPETKEEAAYLRYLQKKHPHVSAELALSGKHGVESLIDHSLEKFSSAILAAAIERARTDGRPVGAVLREVAEKGTGREQEVAQTILRNLGDMLGSFIRDLAVVFKPTGGIYLIGSVSLGLGDYFAEKTDFIKRFIHPGATHDGWIEKIPIYLITDSHVAVKGALSLAGQDS